VQSHVHVGRVGVEGVPDGRSVGRERQPGSDGLGCAVRVATHAVAGRQHELAARLEALPVEGLGAPDGEAGRVAVPGVALGERVAD